MLEQSTPAKTPETRPAPRKPAYRKICGECGQPFIAQRPHATFCCPAHGRTYQNRLQVEGRAIIAFAKAWQAARNRKEDTAFRGEVLNEMCAIINGFVADDKAAGRMDPIKYAKTLTSSGFRYMDRQRSR